MYVTLVRVSSDFLPTFIDWLVAGESQSSLKSGYFTTEPLGAQNGVIILYSQIGYTLSPTCIVRLVIILLKYVHIT